MRLLALAFLFVIGGLSVSTLLTSDALAYGAAPVASLVVAAD